MNADSNVPGAATQPLSPGEVPAGHGPRRISRRVGFGLFVGAVAGMCGWYWSRRPKSWGEVVRGCIYRSGRTNPWAVAEVMRTHRIDVVVDLTTPEGSSLQLAEAEAARTCGVERVVCPLGGDGTGRPQNYVKAVAALARAVAEGKRAWVHCAAGAQRTGGVVASYRLLFEGRSIDEVRGEMIRYGWNPTRDAVLWEYLATNLPGIRDELVAQGLPAVLPEPWPPTPSAPPSWWTAMSTDWTSQPNAKSPPR